MTYEERLQNVSVLGSAGKMGSGILLLTAVEMADLSLLPQNKGKTFVLNAVDVSSEALAGLMEYLRAQVRKIAEKKIVMLRKTYADRADLIENSEILDEYIFDVMRIVRPTTNLESAFHSNLIFEAVNENKDLKINLFNTIEGGNEKKPWYFTNTSSVPIHLLEEGSDLTGRVVGFHFYNPPAVQKLVELITTNNTTQDVKDFALEYAKKLRKIVVPSNDIAGFIGNGHFMRDALHGIQTAEKLAEDMPLTEAILAVNRVTQEYLVRPMGIFQLIDYVGIDVVRFIMQVMNPYMEGEELYSPLLKQLMDSGIKGGQYSSGAQKDGFFKYEKGRIAGIIDPGSGEYITGDEFLKLMGDADNTLGELPGSAVAWKSVLRMKNKDEVLGGFFADLRNSDALGARLAVEYGVRSNQIGKKLVADGVAHKDEDVNTVMLTGFFHAYGPINEYFD
jgi:3-hydroxyacyl-CoA dehydrogenase